MRVEGNGLVSSVYKCPLSQELGYGTLLRKVGLQSKIAQRSEVNFWIVCFGYCRRYLVQVEAEMSESLS